jgi:hypothetical protein
MNGGDTGRVREPVAAKDLAAVKTLGPVAAVDRRDISRFALVTTSRGPQLWASPDCSRESCRQAWDVVFPNAPRTADLNVDHVYSQASARRYGYGYVRLALIKADANQEAGRGWEKLVQRIKPVKQRGIPSIRYAGVVERAKLAGRGVGYKQDAWKGMRQVAAWEHQSNRTAASLANLWTRQLRELDRRRSGGKAAITSLRTRATPQAGGAGGRVIAGLLLLIELGGLVIELCSSQKGAAGGGDDEIRFSLEQLREKEIAEGRMLVPVLKVDVRLPEVLRAQAEDTDEVNRQLLEDFHQQVYWEFESVDMDDYERQMLLAQITHHSALVASQNIFPRYRSAMWPTSDGDISDAVFAILVGLPAIATAAATEASELQVLAAAQREWETKTQEVYLP